MVEGDISVGYVRFRKKCEVALKTLSGSQAISFSFLNENHMQYRLEVVNLKYTG
ncbi:hypothetical protein C2G38_2172600 [Gigaspora rosea]|uniref:Uncharacterized protein n=1 Tax=Gigaspora rosea TaxID=44941 RepID=A0A397VLS8_9GLOM|nr:hypothetical protein C2G38_2172600 [Gigaspora rosea]